MIGSWIQYISVISMLALAVSASQPRLELAPSRIYLYGAESTQQLQVSKLFSNGTALDVTPGAKFTVTKPDLVQVSPSGELKALRPGVVEVKATVGGQQATARVLVLNHRSRRKVDFERDVIPVLTLMGCNGANCHGSMNGKAGFKLSPFGYEADEDYQAIVQGAKGRRVNLAEPEKSLLLAKPTSVVPHGGGMRFEVDSQEHQVLLDWIRSGAPGPAAGGGTRIARLEVFPKERVVPGPSARQQLVVLAHYSDETVEDLTKKVRYVALDGSVLEVGAQGEVAAKRPGESSILIRAPGATAAVRIGVRFPGDSNTAVFPPENNLIDRHVFEKLRRMNVAPSALASDAVFLRRVYLDTLGILPTREETAAFLRDPDRSRLIDRVLAHPNYGEYWGQQWADLFTVSFFKSGATQPLHLDRWLREQFQINTPFDQFARTLLAGTGPVAPEPGLGLIVARTPPEATSFYGQAFLGIRLQCAQCHDHPFEKWRRSDFYGVAAFFSQVTHKNTKQGAVVYDDPQKTFTSPLTKTAATPIFPGDGPASGSEPYRQQFAEWLTRPQNPYFAKAIVNRFWKNFFSVGLVEPVDDFRETNPPSNAPLLEELAEVFVRQGYDMKAFIRLILLSSTYQLASEPSSGNAQDRTMYARYYPRRIPAEPLLDAISQITESSHSFRFGYDGMRAIQLHDPAMYDSFLQAFDRNRREMICERTETHTLLQTLELISGDAVNAKIRNSPLVLRLVGMTDRDAINEVYMRALGRQPEADEADGIISLLAKGQTRQKAMEDLLWSVLNSREFLFNH